MTLMIFTFMKCPKKQILVIVKETAIKAIINDCSNIPDNGVKRSYVRMKDDVPVCCICNDVAKCLKREACLIIEKDLERMKNVAKHFGIHTSLKGASAKDFRIS